MKRSSLLILVFLIVMASHLQCLATKLLTYSSRGETRLGAWIAEGVIDLNRAYERLLTEQGKTRAIYRAGALVPPDMLGLLEGEEDSLSAAKQAIRFVQQQLARPGQTESLQEAGILIPVGDVKVEAPLPNPPHLFSVGLNYRQHAAESGQEIPEYPTIFTKEGRVIGPGDTIMIPPAVLMPDYEVELAFVIGKRASRVSKEEALDYVAGYSTFNDVSARGLQRRVSQWTVGKSVDTFSAMGPYLVLNDEVSNPQGLRLTTRIGADTLQDSNTSDMIFTVAEIVSYLSQVVTLVPGTVITTGTPSGVGAARRPPRFLQPGETVVVEIEKLGVLSNPVARVTN